MGGQFCDSLDLPWDYCKEHKKKHVKFSERFAKMHAPVDHAEIKWAQDWLAQHIKNTDFGYRGHLKHEVPEPYVWDKSFATDYHRLDEEQRYCAVPEYSCVDHKMKHYKFWVILDDLQVP